MQRSMRGIAAPGILSTLLAAMILAAGCRNDGGGDRQNADQPQAQPPLPQTTQQVVGRQTLEVPQELSQIPPVATLPAGEQMRVYNVMGPLRLRVTRADGSTLTEAEVRSGEVLIVDRRSGVRLSRQSGSETLVRGPLDERAAYDIYALPVAGVRQESEQTVIRPETPEEHQARVKALEEAGRRAAEEAATRPAGSGGG